MRWMNKISYRTLFFTQGKEVDAAHPDRPALDSDHWTSYILDNFATVKEAVASIRKKVRLKVIHDFVRIQGDIYDEEPD